MIQPQVVLNSFKAIAKVWILIMWVFLCHQPEVQWSATYAFPYSYIHDTLQELPGCHFLNYDHQSCFLDFGSQHPTRVIHSYVVNDKVDTILLLFQPNSESFGE